ncbi:MAG: hypothetical protein LW690_07540 [Opitutaceae bacterium]|nr:hypothetical protein [Opitutaceae bacterium]
MKAVLALLAPLAASPAFAQSPPEPTEPPRPSVRDALRARAAEDAKKAPTAKTAAPSSANRPPAAATAPATSAAVPAGTSASNESATAKPEGEKASTTVLPKMEVRKGKFSERDYQLAQDLHKQDQEIEREKRNLKTSETDSALNNAKVSSALSVFGGESASYRKRVAAERLELLEAEKDIIEQIAIAQKAEEKQLLQKQLDELREMRRQLDKTLR